MDPLAEGAPDWTPYRYGFNNPVKFIDPNGMFEYSDGYGTYDSRNSTMSKGAFSGTYEGTSSDLMSGSSGSSTVIAHTEEGGNVVVPAGGIGGGCCPDGGGTKNSNNEAQGGGDDPYQYIGSQDRAYSMSEFIAANKGLTRQQIVSQMDNRSKTFLNSQQGGPSLRYVTNPHDGKVLDMRHMLIVGNLPPVVGNLVEVGQWLSGQASGMNPQDFYSNGVGYQFYMQYSGLQNFFYPTTFTNQLQNFFYSPRVIINH